jgi:hypothetical protein
MIVAVVNFMIACLVIKCKGKESCVFVVACLTIVECSAQTKDYDQKIERDGTRE